MSRATLLGQEARWIARQVRPLLRLSIANLLCIVIASSLTLLDPLIIKWLIDVAIPRRSLKLVLIASLAFCFTYLASMGMNYLATIVSTIVGQKLVFRARLRILRRVNNLPAAYHSNTQTGETLYRIHQDVDRIAELSGDIVPMGMHMLIVGIMVIVTMSILNWRLTAIVVPLLPAFYLLQTSFGRRLKAAADAAQQQSGKMAAFLQEHLAGMLQLQLLNRTTTQMRKFAHISAESSKRQIQQRVTEGMFGLTSASLIIDGQPAGIAPVSPWVYTGFLPDQWVPIPGAQTLDFVPYRVNLTPFAGVLNDGNPHTVALSIFNDDSYFSVTASLLLFLDHGSTQVSGAVTKNTLTAPSPVVTEDLQGTSTVTGTIGVLSDRKFAIAGYVQTSHGKVATTVAQHQKFNSTQTIDFDTVNGTVFDQKTILHSSVASDTTVVGLNHTRHITENFDFPIDVHFKFPVNKAEFGFTVVTHQEYHRDRQVLTDGLVTAFGSTTNTVKASDINPPSSSQEYVHSDSLGGAYDCQITATNNTLATVSTGCSAQNQ